MSALEVVPDSPAPVRRGTSNRNERGSSYSRRARRQWLVETYRANVDLILVEWAFGGVSLDTFVVTVAELRTFPGVVSAEAVPACRCYRCGALLTAETLTVDRIIPGCKGGTYRRDNIRPACGPCNSETGGPLANGKVHQPAKKRARVGGRR